MLIRRNPNATVEAAPAVETAAQSPVQQTVAAVDNPSTGAAPAPTTPQAAQTAAPAVQIPVKPAVQPASTQRAVLVRPAGALTAAVKAMPEPILNAFKDAFSVEYDTFERLKAGAGDIQDNSGNSLGREIAIELRSWQHAWDIGMGDDSAKAKEFVRYSDDGVTIKDSGQTIADYLEEVRPMYPNAKVAQKMVLVGVLLAAENPTNLLDRTVQVSLSSQARKTFDRYNFDRTFDVASGKQPAEGSNVLSIKALPKKTGTNNWTLLQVGPAEFATE